MQRGVLSGPPGFPTRLSAFASPRAAYRDEPVRGRAPITYRAGFSRSLAGCFAILRSSNSGPITYPRHRAPIPSGTVRSPCRRICSGRAFSRKSLYPPQLVGDLCVSLDADRLGRALPRLSSSIPWHDLLNRMSATDVVGREIFASDRARPRRAAQCLDLYNLLLVEFCDFPFLKKDLVFQTTIRSPVEEALRSWDGGTISTWRRSSGSSVRAARCAGCEHPRRADQRGLI